MTTPDRSWRSTDRDRRHTGPAQDPARALLDSLAQVAGQAAERCGGWGERSVRLADHSIRLRFAGPALVEPLTQAFEHLRDNGSSDPADLEVFIWDSRSTATPMPPPPWPPEAIGPRGEVVGFNDHRCRVVFDNGALTLQAFDRQRSRGFFWIRDANELASWDRAAPLRTMFAWWTRTRGMELAHAAAIGTTRGALLLTAPGGSGKSTTALASVLGHPELRFLGDDYVVLSSRPARVHTLYASAKLDWGHLRARLPELRHRVLNPQPADRGKAVLMAGEVLGERLARELPVRAIVVPRLGTRSRPRLRPISHAEVVRALVPTTVFQLPGGGPASFRFLTDFARPLPGYGLTLGSQLEDLGPLLADLLLQLPES